MKPLFSLKPCRARAGFSHIELLIVFTILTILAAILIPTFQTVKKKARSLTCMNNLRQIGSAMMLYTADHGHYPYSSHLKVWADWGEFLVPYFDQLTENNKWVPGDSWACGLYKLNDGSGQHLANEVGQGTKDPGTGTVYTPGYPYFTCPEGPASRQNCSYKGNAGIHVYSHNYSCNEFIMPYGRWSNSPANYPDEPTAEAAYIAGSYIPFPPVRPSELERPGSLILVCDAGVDGNIKEASDTMFSPMYFTYQPGSPENPSGVILGGIVDNFLADPAGESANGETSVTTPPASDADDGNGYGWPVYYRHGGKCNALMADGHVESFSNGQIKRRNFVSKGRVKNWANAGVGYVEAFYP